jgi:NADH-quinone oxidoreductase subunit M
MLVFFGAFGGKLPHSQTFTVVATLGIVLGAVYILVMIQKVFLGKPRERHEHPLSEPNVREWAMLAPLAAMAIWIGCYPRVALDVIDKPVAAWCKGFPINEKETGKLPGEGK